MTPHTVIVPFGYYGTTFKVDLDDFDLVRQHHWALRRKPDRVYVYTLIAKRKVQLHRLLLGITDDPKTLVDHINGDGLDNRRCNLRTCTHKQNSENQRIHRNNTSGFKGVRRSRDKWRAVIQHNGKKISLGSFATPQEAHNAYVSAARNFFGDFANGGHYES